jgi:acetylornithine deacetylase/succinyl-diaminopimelate desuccinylase-like protein
MFNVSGVRKGTGGGPLVVFAAHTDTMFPDGTPATVRREGNIPYAPGVGDDADGQFVHRARRLGSQVRQAGGCR